ncbi:hypothetical protein PZB75_16875 [Streptomyces sp. AM 4-1-1]|uniref:hypothetical protein n=1 Tax=Streptomyces sp. AM 4-1-1 TaxID=3028710 RepID=UPI0023B9BCD3|nr:hypothetical protein [Streptomyces sp. AM 4-1-1]WEH34879.1 hypothetical protein PZB75_16875 [Streptomyces sp. AM 4-1-1]
MRIHRTRQTTCFSTFGNALLRDRSISWCAAGVLVYLLSLPEGARASVRALAAQRREGRATIANALRELEDSRYLRRLVLKNADTGQLITVYEVFDSPYDQEMVQNLASGEPDTGVAGPLPKGERTGEQVPPSPAHEHEPHPDQRPVRRPRPRPAPSRRRKPVLPRLSALSVPEQLRSATELLLSLGRRDVRLTLGTAEAVRLAPKVEEWRAAGASDAQLREALTAGLPAQVLSAPGLVMDRLRRKLPTPPPAAPPQSPPRPGECAECGAPVNTAGECRACTTPAPARRPELQGYIQAAQRGRAAVRAALGARDGSDDRTARPAVAQGAL